MQILLHDGVYSRELTKPSHWQACLSQHALKAKTGSMARWVFLFFSSVQERVGLVPLSSYAQITKQTRTTTKLRTKTGVSAGMFFTLSPRLLIVEEITITRSAMYSVPSLYSSFRRD